MTAYKTSELNNLLLRETAEEAFYEELIDEATYTNILQRHPHTLYTPNFFIRVGLALLTVVICLATLILLGLILYSGASGDGAFISLLIILSMASYIALEVLVSAKKYYNAGTDNVLMLCTIGFAWGAYAFASPNLNCWATIVLCVISAWLCYRFTSVLMGMVAYIFLLVSLYMLCLQLQAVKAIPFVLMAASAVIYIAMNKLYELPKSLYYRKAIAGMALLTIISFYLCGNYFFVSQLASTYSFAGGQSLNVFAAPFFWLCTLLMPIGYLLYGIQVKSRLFMRCGIILLVIGIATLHYYYDFMPANVLLMLGGIILIATSSMLITYLREKRGGFMLGDNTRKNHEHFRNIEALVITQAVSAGHSAAPQQTAQFGGGSSGGGGATGDY